MKRFISGLAIAVFCFSASAGELKSNTQDSDNLFGLGAFWGTDSSYDQEFRGGLEASISSISSDETPFFSRKSFLLAADYRNGISAGISYSGFWEPIRYTSGSLTISANIGAGLYVGTMPECWGHNDHEEDTNHTADVIYSDESGDTCPISKVAIAGYPELGARISYGVLSLSPFVRYYVGDSNFLTSGVSLALTF
ncbi:hypothetical protein [Vibrio penaeicida]|uniref:hypothetical protein n=1 Tax=Vibrio penaeicida TaxID=104609 RepID=UPI000CE9FE4E|nr:hypothetical protein [Vibrio penaeicida]